MSQESINLAFRQGSSDKIYNAEEEPIIILLSDQDKLNIQNMLPSATMYAVYPDTTKKIDVEKMMDRILGNTELIKEQVTK